METHEQRERLLQLGCEVAQGFGIAHPMPADALTGWLADRRQSPDRADLPPDSRRNLPGDQGTYRGT